MARFELLKLSGAVALVPFWSLSPTARADSMRDAMLFHDCPAVTSSEAISVPEHWMRASCLLELQRPAEALVALDAVSGANLPEAGLGLLPNLLRAEALLSLGRASEAAAVPLAAPGLPTSVAQRRSWLQARIAVANNRVADGEALAQSLIRDLESLPRAKQLDIDPADLRQWVGERATERGDDAEAVAQARAVWTLHPERPANTWAEQLLRSQGHDPSDLATPAAQDLVRARIRTLEKVDLDVEALAWRDALAKVVGPAPDRTMAGACFRAKDYARATTYFARLDDRSPSEGFDYALATARAGDYDLAAQRYRELMTKSPTTAEADTASFKLGYMAYDEGRLEDGIALFREHLTRYPASKHADEARWFIGWSLWRLAVTNPSRIQEAATALDELTRRHPQSTLAPAGAYWKARLAGLAGDTATERTALEAVAKVYPLTAYAWYADRRLGTSYAATTAAPTAPASPTSGAMATATWLLEAGELAWARAALEGLPVPADRASALSRARLLVDAEDYGAARRLAAPYCKGPTTTPSDARAVCFPWPYRDVLTAVGLPDHLAVGIMTAESNLDPTVTSVVGARGLMQLMPNLGMQLWAARSAESYDARDLYRASINARLGADELRQLTDRFAGRLGGVSLPAVIAAYNAGADPVTRWLDASPHADFDVWAETISFSETRGYVRRVLATIQTYTLAYGSSEKPAAQSASGTPG